MPNLAAQRRRRRTAVRSCQGAGAISIATYGHLTDRGGATIVGAAARNDVADSIAARADDAVLMIEATGSAAYRLPDRGLVGAACDLRSRRNLGRRRRLDDAFQVINRATGEWKVQDQTARRRSRPMTYPFNPLDAVGWTGQPRAGAKLNWRDIRPDREPPLPHAALGAFTTFVADRFVVCTFVPRPIETDPGALKVPFFHNPTTISTR